MKKSELRKIVKEELQVITEKKSIGSRVTDGKRKGKIVSHRTGSDSVSVLWDGESKPVRIRQHSITFIREAGDPMRSSYKNAKAAETNKAQNRSHYRPTAPDGASISGRTAAAASQAPKPKPVKEAGDPRSAADFEKRANMFLKGVQAISDKNDKKNAPSGKEYPVKTKFVFTKGRRFWKIVRQESTGGKSVYAFIDHQSGDVLKAAGWNAPAKHARSNVFDNDYGLSAAGPYGMAYLR